MAESSIKNSMVEPSSCYFLHSSDHPGLLLVTKRLDGNNYATWRRSMVIALTAKNKIGFVNGAISAPDAKKKPDDYALWERCDKMVLSWLLNSVEADLADGVVYADTAQEIWNDFHERFSQGNAPRIFQLERAIGSHVQGNTSVAIYYTKLKTLWDELASYKTQPTCTCGGMKLYHEQREQDQLMQFLMGLHESYNSTRGHILLMNPLPSVRRAYSLISQEERQREIGSLSTDGVSLAASVQRNGGANASRFGGANASRFGGTNASRFGSKQQIGESSALLDHLHCTYCDRDRHTIENCYKLHGYPPGHRLYRGGSSNEENVGNSGPRPSNRGRRGGGVRNFPSAHQVNVMNPSVRQPAYTPNLGIPDSTSNELRQVLNGLSEEQCKQLTAAMVNLSKPPSENSDVFANAAGLGFEEDDWLGPAE